MISSGTTSKQINSEGDAKMIGYGSMLIECVLAVIALIAVGSASMDSWSGMNPPQVFAAGISTMLGKIGLTSGDFCICTDITGYSNEIGTFPVPGNVCNQ